HLPTRQTDAYSLSTMFFFFSSRRRHTSSVSAFLLNRSSDLFHDETGRFIAAVIAYYVHPVNIQTACLIMEGAEFTENIINGVERPVKAAELDRKSVV